MQDKMMLGNIHYVFYYQVIYRDFKQSNILSPLSLYARCSPSGLKNPILPLPPSLCYELLLLQPMVQLILLTLLSYGAILSCYLSQTACCH